MTIFQKMLIVPVMSLLLYSGFIVYSYSEHRQSSEKILEIRDHYLPLFEMTNESENLFREIRNIYKDAVLADESAWLPQAKYKSQQLLLNLTSLNKYLQIIELQKVEKIQKSFSSYQENVELLAKKVLENNEKLIDQNDLVKNVEHYHNETEVELTNLKISIKARFHQTIDETNKVMNTLLFLSSFIAIGLLIFLLVVTFAVSLSTYLSFKEVILRLKELAQGGTDFSRRLVHNKKDELGYLIHWFNKLSDKLEQDYLHLEMISITDKLTQLNNRTRTDSYFSQVIAEAHQQSMSLAVILIDVDNFKKINDKYGHLVGDKVLQCFAQILKDNALEHSFIGRWGGEEFILIISDMSIDKATVYANLVREKIAQEQFEDVGKITASFGISSYHSKDTPNTLMKRADDALYQAKDAGRNCVFTES